MEMKKNKWAKISFYCTVFGWVIPIASLVIVEILEIPADNKGWNSFSIIPIVSIVLITLALVTGIVGLIDIFRGKGAVRGGVYVTASFLGIFLYLCVLFLPPYIAYRKSPPIHRAAGDGDIATVKSLLAKKPKLVNSKSIYPLHLSVPM